MQPILARPPTQPPHLIRKPFQLLHTQILLVLSEKDHAALADDYREVAELSFGVGGGEEVFDFCVGVFTPDYGCYVNVGEVVQGAAVFHGLVDELGDVGVGGDHFGCLSRVRLFSSGANDVSFVNVMNVMSVYEYGKILEPSTLYSAGGLLS